MARVPFAAGAGQVVKDGINVMPPKNQTNKNIIVRHSLSLAVAGALTLSASAAFAEDADRVVADGTAVVVSAGTIETHSEYMHALEAMNEGSIVAADADLVTHGEYAVGILARGAGSTVLLNGGTLTNTGDLGNASGNEINLRYGTVLARDSGQIELNDVEVDNQALTGDGARVGTALLSQSAGSSIVMNRGSLSGAMGATARDGGVITLNDVSIDATQQGVNALDASTITMIGGRIDMVASKFRGEAVLSADGSTVTVDGVSITTANGAGSGPTGHGVLVLGDSTANVLGSDIHTQGTGAAGVQVGWHRNALTGGLANVDNTVIRSDAGDGVLLQGQDARAVVTGSHIIAAQNGVYAGYGADARVTASRVEAGQIGIDIAVGSRAELTDSLVTVDTLNGYGLAISNDSSAQLSNTDVFSQGTGAVIAAGSLVMEGSSLASVGGDAFSIHGKADITLSNGAQAIGGNGRLMSVDDESHVVSLGLTGASYGEGDVRFGAAADGDANGQLERHVDIALGTRSQWRGATDAVSTLSLAGGSQWSMTSDSSVGELSLQNSTIAFESPTTGPFKTLTVNGDFTAENGVLLMNATLGDDRSATDKLHVQGDTSGSAAIAVNNVGGAGAETQDGIQIVQVDGASNADFTLAGRAVGGLYEYFLFKGGKTDPSDGDYYLRSELHDAPPSCDEDPTGEGCESTEPTDPTTPVDPPAVLRPEVGGFLANQAAAMQLFTQRHHDRSGTADGRGAWARVTRTQAQYGVVGDQLNVDGAANTLQVGSDVWAWDGGRGQIGVMAGRGTSNSTVTSYLTGYGARGKVTGNMMGVYASWVQSPKQEGGLYVDGSLQYARFDNSIRGDTLEEESYGSRAGIVSAEAGYGLKLYDTGRSALFVEPQLQLSYRQFNADSLIEANGTLVDGSDADGWSSRVGLRVFGHATTDAGSRVQPFMEANWIRESAKNSVSFDHEQLEGGLPKNRYQVKTGAEIRLNSRWSGWGDIGVQRGDRDYKEVSAQIGLRANW